MLNVLSFHHVAEKLQVSSYVVHDSDDAMAHAFRHVRKSHPQVETIPCYFPALSRSIGKGSAIIRFCRSVLKLLVPGLLHDTALDAAVRHANVIVSNGGLYFGFKPENFMFYIYHLFAFSYPMLLGFRLGRPFVLFGQSFGPFPSRFAESWMRRLIDHSEGAWCRESMSEGVLVSLGINKSKLRIIPDAAFTIKPTPCDNGVRALYPKLIRREYVAISLRSLTPFGLPEELEHRYRVSFRQAIEWLVTERNVAVALIAHTFGPVADEDDRVITREVYATLLPDTSQHVVVCEDDISPGELASLYGEAKVVIATRFHAAVLSICGGAPVIALPYFGVKTQGAFHDLGLSSLILEIADTNDQVLIRKVRYCLDNEAALRTKIERIADQQFALAMHSGALLKKVSRT